MDTRHKEEFKVTHCNTERLIQSLYLRWRDCSIRKMHSQYSALVNGEFLDRDQLDLICIFYQPK